MNTQTHVGKPSRKAATPSLSDGVAALHKDTSPDRKRHCQLEGGWLHCGRGRMHKTSHVCFTMAACSHKRPTAGSGAAKKTKRQVTNTTFAKWQCNYKSTRTCLGYSVT